MPGGARIEQRRRLVEHERVRIGEHEPREGELLGLRRRERGAAGADDRLQPIGQRLHPVRRVDGVERRQELGVGRSCAREPQVVGERADEDVLLLRHERDLAAERVELEIDERHAPDLDRARRGRMDPGEQAAERRLARPRGADDGDPLARLEVEPDPVQDVASGNVGVTHVVGAQPVVLRLLAGRLRSGGTSAMPTSRANEAPPTWTSSSHESRRSTGSASCWM